MKKVYLLVSGLILTAGAVNAQIDAERAYHPMQKNMRSQAVSSNIEDRAPGAIILSNTFDDVSDWLIYTEGGTDPVWDVVLTEPPALDGFIGDMASTTQADGFGVFDGIQYLDGGVITVQNALLELDSSINCTGIPGVILTFEQAYRAFNRDQTFLEVTNDGWATFEVYEFNTEKPGNGPTFQELISVNISSVAGGEADVRVRFRWLEETGEAGVGSGYAWMVDDLNIRESWNYDQEITAGFHRAGAGISDFAGYGYYTIAQSQATTPIVFIGQTQSLAGLVQVNSKLNVEVTGAGTFSSSSTPADLAVADTDSVRVEDEFTPDAIGTYNIEYSFDSDNLDEDPSNNTIADEFRVHDYLYSRSNGIISASVSNTNDNAGQPFQYGNVMDIFADDEIGAIDISISTAATNVGQEIYGQIMLLEDDGSFTFLDQTGNHEITSGENGGTITIFFEDAIEVLEGQSVLVLAGHYGGDDVQFSTAQAVKDTTIFGYTSGATTPFFFNGATAVDLTIHMRSYVSLDEEVANNFAISQNMPNPFGDNSVINYELNEAAAVSVDFVDVSGKIVKSINNGTQDAGTYTLAVDANDFAEGVYFYTFTVGAEKVTKRMVITK